MADKHRQPTLRDLECYKGVIENVKELFRVRSHSAPNSAKIEQLRELITANFVAEAQNPYLADPPNGQNPLKRAFEHLASTSFEEDAVSAAQPHLSNAMNKYEIAKRERPHGPIGKFITSFFGDRLRLWQRDV